MAQYAWVITAVVLIGLLQLAVYYYLSRRRGTTPFDEPAAGDGTRAVTTLSDDTRGGDTDDGLACQSCGAVNESGFTFCRNCTARIGS